MTEPRNAEARSHFRRTLIRVMAVQIVSLAILWIIQTVYGS